MTAICGVINLDGSPILPSELERMMSSMAHRGPDGYRTECVGSVGFGQQLCHLTDTTTLAIADKNLLIVADVRLDNRADLCKQFALPDYLTISDALLIRCAYLKWQQDCPKYLLGEFAIAIWDKRTQEFLCCVDHTGCRTLYYYHDQRICAFATEIHALHALKRIPRQPNMERIAATNYFVYNFKRPQLTYFAKILRLPRATILAAKNNRLTLTEYWQPDIGARVHFSSEDEYIAAFQALFAEIVRAKLRSNKPVISLLSGGLDSSAITSMAAHLLAQNNKNLTAFSAQLPTDYQGTAYDESSYINLINNQNINKHAIIDNDRGPFDCLQTNFFATHQPDITSRYFLYQAFATAAEAMGSRVILDGCYGESGPSFHGKGYFAELLIKFKWQTLLHETSLHAQKYQRNWLRLLLSEGVIPCLPGNWQAKFSLRNDIVFSEKLTFINRDLIKQYLPESKILQQEQLDFNARHPNHRVHQSMLPGGSRDAYFLSDNQQPVCFSYPYYDKRMLQFCLSLPGNLKVKNGYKRYAIRSGMRGLMADELRFRTTKEPFSPDFHHRFNRQLEMAREFVANQPMTPLITAVIDVPRLKHALQQQMETNRCSTARDFTAMHSIPSALYLMAFLATFA